MKTKFLIFLFLSSLLFAEKPHLLLLKVYKDQNITGWVMSEKLDGVRAFWDGKHLVSRGGKIIHAPQWFIEDYPPFAIDGELWSRRGGFDSISSIVRDKIPSQGWHQITHNIFEVPNAKGNLWQRLEKVKPYENRYIKIIKQIPIKDKQNLKKYLQEIEAKKGEGVVVRDPLVPYIAKRTSKALKVKTFYDTECTVVDYKAGKGKNKGAIGSLKCQLNNGTIFYIGSGFTHKERRSPPKIGSVVTFKYKEFTKNGKPRFPVFLRIKKQF
ncbi:MAG: DNA ligase [Sulfurimonas sp.]|nr:DNA ligase [Sulfurimonas sp.]